MKSQALAAYAPGGVLDRYQFDMNELSVGYVRIKVHFCGLSRSDLHMIDNDWFMSQYPLVAGHEVIGEVVAIGSDVAAFDVGDRVGLGWHSDYCHVCDSCTADEQNLCGAAEATVVGRHGGFAQFVDAHEEAVVHIPDLLEGKLAAPLMSAGACVFNPLVQFSTPRNAKAAVIGVGGLGHLALQIYQAWGMEVTAFTHSMDKSKALLDQGVQHVVNVYDENAMLEQLGQFDFILSTVTDSLDWQTIIACLKPKGRLHFVGVPMSEVHIGVFPLLSKQRCISGSQSASPAVIEDMLEFVMENEIQPQVQLFEAHQLNEALNALRSGTLRYRAVIDMSGLQEEHEDST